MKNVTAAEGRTRKSDNTDMCLAWSRTIGANADQSDEIRMTWKSLLSGSDYWLDMHDVTIENDQRDPFITIVGGELEEPVKIRRSFFVHAICDFALSWLTSSDVDRRDKYITRSNRLFMGGDFNGWACSIDSIYKDQLLQFMLFGKAIYA